VSLAVIFLSDFAVREPSSRAASSLLDVVEVEDLLREAAHSSA
jgi:hypothetical protein